jgi:hypothetical protein
MYEIQIQQEDWDEGQWTHIQPTEEQLPTENWFYLDDDDKEFPCLG